jgi:hypothetical protein
MGRQSTSSHLGTGHRALKHGSYVFAMDAKWSMGGGPLCPLKVVEGAMVKLPIVSVHPATERVGLYVCRETDIAWVVADVVGV